MVDNTIVISVMLVLAAFALMIKASRISKDPKKDKEKIPEVEQLKNLNENDSKKELDQIILILKSYLRRRYNLNTKLSLDELSEEVKKQNENRLEPIFNKLKRKYYAGKEATTAGNKRIKKTLIDTITKIENHHEKERIKKKRNETVFERIQNKEKRIKEEIRVQKMLHSKLKKRPRKTK